MATTGFTVSPLPALNTPQIRTLSEKPDVQKAYNIILQAEQHAVQHQARENIISARTVGYFLLEFHARSGTTFSGQPCAILVEWVMPGENDPNVVFLIGREYLIGKLMRTFRTCKTRYPQPSTHPSQPSFDTLEDMIKDSMEATGKDYRTSRRKALARDGYRCVISGVLDENSVLHSKELLDMLTRDSLSMASIEAAHIFNESTTQDIESEGTSGDGRKAHFAAGAMAMLKMFGFGNLSNALMQSGGVHQVWNLLSLDHHLHDMFDHLNLWFERTDEEHHYRVCVARWWHENMIHDLSRRSKRYVDGAPIIVNLASQVKGVPAPEPDLLALHATCARVAHMSGAAEYLEEIQRDMEDIEVLAFDGSSAPLLSNLISPFSLIEGLAG